MATTPNLTDEQMTAQFLAFCRSKPRDEKYSYRNNSKCAFAQFVKAAGICEDPDIGAWSWGPRGSESRSREMPAGVNDAVAGFNQNWRVDPVRTFGALADRVAALMAEPTQ